MTSKDTGYMKLMGYVVYKVTTFFISRITAIQLIGEKVQLVID